MTSLRQRIATGKPLIAIGATDALSARLKQARTIADTVSVPVIADAEGGFDDPAATVRAFEAVAARRHPDILIAARSDAFWVFKDLEETVRRLKLYAEAGADLVFPTLAGPAELAEVRRRIDRPAMVVDLEHPDAAVTLHYAFPPWCSSTRSTKRCRG